MVAFANLLEQETAARVLTRHVRQGRVSHAYLFTGPEGVGKTFTALSFAQALNCLEENPNGCGTCRACRKISRFTHPDVRLVFAVPSTLSDDDCRQLLEEKVQHPLRELSFAKKSSISIAQVRGLKEEISLGLFEGRWKTVIIRDAEDMTPEAANSLLKVLEEPRERTTFVLTSSRPQALFSTVRSRCQRVRFFALSVNTVKGILLDHLDVEEARAELAAAFSSGSVTLAARMVGEDMTGERELALEAFGDVKPKAAAIRQLAALRDRAVLDRVLRFALGWYRDLLLIKLGSGERVSNVDKRDRLSDEVTKFDLDMIKRRIDMLERLREAIELNVSPAIAVETIAASWKEPGRLAGCSLFSSGSVDYRWWNW